MATSDGNGIDGCLLQRGKSQSDPNLLTESSIDLVHNTVEVMDQQRVLHSGCLVSGVHTPPIRRNSKLASLGRIFKPWKWRKKKNEKLKQSSTGERLIGKLHKHAHSPFPLPYQIRPGYGPHTHAPTIKLKSLFLCLSDPSAVPSHLVNSFLPKELPRTPESLAPMVALRGPVSNPSGSPHLANIMHLPMPPSCIMEELQRAFASKANRQESSENPSMASGGVVDWLHQAERKEAEENKENMRLDQCFSDASGLPHDQDDWNDSVISGTLPRRLRKELLAVKLRNRPSKEELEDRNIFPARTEQERQEIRQQIEMKLTKRLSQRPNVEELESRNILKQRNDQTEQEERREIKQRLNRKLNQRPTVDELRDRKILIRFSDYVEVAKAQDYDRRADKPWTRLSAADKAAIRKELNEFKSTEMEVHASSKHLTRFHRP
uniref:Phosphatase and actin regulator n=1 Tax=Oncorhynchus mykiss TaxID=8022 RepID=A0A8C7NH08_ONCMY